MLYLLWVGEAGVVKAAGQIRSPPLPNNYNEPRNYICGRHFDQIYNVRHLFILT